MRATIIIGANYGDEGKGLITDYFARKYKNSIVVRHNGGSQAAHTVQYKGLRHVFHHVGSGTLAGRPTYLSSHFLSDPIRFLKELNELNKIIKNTKMQKCYVNVASKIVTPWDCILNQMSSNLDTCGCGINETLNRIGKHPDLNLFINTNKALEVINKIAFNYFPKEILKRYGKAGLKTDLYNTAASLSFVDAFFNDFKNFSNCTSPTTSLKDMLICRPDIDHIIFEGAQGLMLNQNHKNFPFVTRSNTGVKNAIEMCRKCDISDIEVVYVTRAYMTRHGAGPFPHEINTEIIDKTNIENTYQGKMRFAKLQPYLICEEILKDITPYNNVRVSLAMTCMDQIGSLMFIDNHGAARITKRKRDIAFLISTLTNNLFDRFMFSYGPEGKDIISKKNNTRYFQNFKRSKNE
jgi:adenylosuccinate synthase